MEKDLNGKWDIMTDVLPKPSGRVKEGIREPYPFKTKKYNNIVAGLKKLESEYKSGTRRAARDYAENALSELQAESEAAMLEQAERALRGTYDKKKEDELESYKKKLAKLESEPERIESEKNEALEKTERTYSEKERKALEALSRRGMTGSSAAELTLGEIKSDRAKRENAARSAYDEETAALERRIASIEAAHKAALEEFDIDYAIKLENKLKSLAARRESMEKKLGHDEESKLIEAEGAYLDRLKRENEAYEAEFNDYEGDKKKNYEARLEYAIRETEALSKKDKEELLKNHSEELKEYLGLYYDKYLERIGG